MEKVPACLEAALGGPAQALLTLLQATAAKQVARTLLDGSQSKVWLQKAVVVSSVVARLNKRLT